jgi:periplasmic protein TonB
MSPDRRTGGSVLSRSGPMIAVIGIHAVILYLLMVSMGVVDAPEFVPPVEAVFIPEQTQTQPEELPVVKPDLADIAEPTEQPPPEIQFDEVVVPPSDIAMPASNNAPAATTAPAGQVQDLKTKTRIEPTYPPASRRASEEGTVRLKVLVDESGRPKDVQVAQSSGFTRLDEAAKQAVRKWRFQAASNGGQAMSVWTQVAITFRLTDGQ